jgi:hypothetical protein
MQVNGLNELRSAVGLRDVACVVLDPASVPAAYFNKIMESVASFRPQVLFWLPLREAVMPAVLSHANDQVEIVFRDTDDEGVLLKRFAARAMNGTIGSAVLSRLAPELRAVHRTLALAVAAALTGGLHFKKVSDLAREVGCSARSLERWCSDGRLASPHDFLAAGWLSAIWTALQVEGASVANTASDSGIGEYRALLRMSRRLTGGTLADLRRLRPPDLVATRIAASLRTAHSTASPG